MKEKIPRTEKDHITHKNTTLLIMMMTKMTMMRMRESTIILEEEEDLVQDIVSILSSKILGTHVIRVDL